MFYIAVNNLLKTFKDIMGVCGDKLYFTYRPPDGIKRPTGTKEGEKGGEKGTDSSGEINA